MEQEQQQQQQPTWLELLGSNNWDGLLDPLNLDLRRLILRCGDLIQVTYDTFINDQNSKYCGSSRYGKKTLLKNVYFPEASSYDVVSFIYGTAVVGVPEVFFFRSRSRERWDRETNWIGYVAVTNDEVSKALGRREIYVAWRGTMRTYEWINVLGADMESATPLLAGDLSNGQDVDDKDEERGRTPKIMRGWLTIYTSNDPESPFTKLSARSQLLAKMKLLIERYKDENLSITFVGHSLGACLSVISAFDVVENLTSSIPVSAIIFGCPRVGNRAFNNRLNSHSNLKVLHVRNVIDLFCLYPTRFMGYVDTPSVVLKIDTRKSPYLKDSKDPGDWHNLQGMLHVVAGWNGDKGEFEMKIERSVALVNKSCDFLKDECMVPGLWWVDKNKGMVLNKDGVWVMKEPDGEDLPVPEFD